MDFDGKKLSMTEFKKKYAYMLKTTKQCVKSGRGTLSTSKPGARFLSDTKMKNVGSAGVYLFSMLRKFTVLTHCELAIAKKKG